MVNNTRIYPNGHVCDDEYASLHLHSSVISGLAFSSDGRVLVSASFDNSVCITDARTLESIVTIHSPHNDVISQIVLSGSNKYLVSASWDGKTRFKNWHVDLSNSDFVI